MSEKDKDSSKKLGIAVMSVDPAIDLWRVAVIVADHHRQAGEIVEWQSNPLPKSLADSRAEQVASERGLPIIAPD